MLMKSLLHVLSQPSPQEIYKTIIEEVKKLTGASYGTILLQTEGKLKRVYADSKLIQTTQVRANGRTWKAYTTRKPHIAYVKGLNDLNPTQHVLGIRSIVFIPLAYKNDAIGVLNILSREHIKAIPSELNRLSVVGSMMYLAIQKAQLYEETKTLLDAKSLFMDVASHELKTPLTAMQLYLAMLQKQLNEGVTPEKKRVDLLVKETKRVTDLIGELLHTNARDYAHLSYKWKQYSFVEICEQAIDEFKALHPNHTVEFKNKSKQKSSSILADFDKILQVLLNILNNAAKFSPIGSIITMTLNKKDNTLQLTIKDRGEGIGPEELPHVFDRFYRGSKTTKKGMGLGLYLSKQIIAKHGGGIWISSKRNKGTTVHVILPEYKNAKRAKSQ